MKNNENGKLNNYINMEQGTPDIDKLIEKIKVEIDQLIEEIKKDKTLAEKLLED